MNSLAHFIVSMVLVASLAACSSPTEPSPGDARAGDSTTGGDGPAGDPGGDPNAGDPNAGDPSSGDPSSGDPNPGDTPPPEFCDGSTFAFYAPNEQWLDTFPDDFFTIDDGTTATGVRVNMTAANVALPTGLVSHDEVLTDISTLDGFGVNARAYVSLSGALDLATLPNIADSDSATSSVLLVDLDHGELVEFEAEELTSPVEYVKSTLLITPVHSLAPKTRYGLVLLRSLRDLAGGCIEPSVEMKDLLTRTASDAAYSRLHGRYQALITFLENQSLINHVTDISHAVVFGTQSTTDQSAEIATAIASQTVTYNAIGGCITIDADFNRCEGELLVADYRTNHRHVSDDLVPNSPPYSGQSLKIATYLPKATGPHATVIYGHGLGGDRHQAETLANCLCPLGIAVVAVDAVKHGDHYDAATSGSSSELILEMFGISYPPTVLDIRRARDNFRQSTYDKLHLLNFIVANHDVDSDGTDDFDATRLGYVGVSLGGIMGAELVALAPQIDAYATIVSGARLIDVIATVELDLGVGPVSVAAALFSSTSAAERARFFPLMQSVLDRGDPGSYAGYVLTDRLSGFASARPHVLMQMAKNDQVVPNITNTFYARELGLPIVGTVIVPIYGAANIAAYPISLNVSGTHTAGLQQFDQLDSGANATHGTLPDDPIALPQTREFLQSTFDTGSASILAPQ